MPVDLKALHIPPIFESLDRCKFERLDAITSGVFDCPHSTPQLTDVGPIVVRTQDIMTGVLRVDNAAHVSEETYRDRIVRAEPSYGDLLYSREGTYFGIAAEVPSGTRVCLGQRMVLIRSKPDRIDHRYLKYWLNSPQIAAHIHGFRDGTVAERLNLPVIRGLPVFVPELSAQRAIAEVLGSLDDKIEQNRRTGRKLEELARAVFKAWFVDFEPVKAKIAGATAFPGMPAAAFAQLPNRLVDSEIGKVPDGWTVATLRDIATFITGGTPSKKEPTYWDGDFPWVSAKDMHGRIIDDSELRLTEAGLASVRRTAPRHATLMVIRGMSLMTEVRIGWCTREVAFNQDLRAFIARDGVPPEFLYLWLTASEAALMGMVDTASHGTGRILTDRLDGMTIARPHDSVMNAFTDQCRPSLALRESLHAECRKLAALRDYLLPRLLSGKVRVNDTDAAVAVVA